MRAFLWADGRMTALPESAYIKTGDLLYFTRLLSKIRLFAAGELREDFHRNLGRGADKWCCEFLRVEYEKLRIRVLEGGSDEEILAWVIAQGRDLNETDILVWNHFAASLGRKDFASGVLEKFKKSSGLEGREDIDTMVEYFEYDEGRKS